MDVRRIAIPAKLGLALLAAWPALTIGLSAVGERVALVQAVAVLGLLPALLGAVTWLRAGQRSRKVFVQKRLFVAIAALSVISTPLTQWPLFLSLVASIPVCNHFMKQTRFISDCWLGPLHAKYVDFRADGSHSATLQSGVEIQFVHGLDDGILVLIQRIDQPRERSFLRCADKPFWDGCD